MRVEVLLVTVLLLVVVAGTNNTYTKKFDSIAIERVLNNRRMLNRYIDCLLEEGSCTAEGRYLRCLLPDALRTTCSKCSKKQKIAAEKAVKFLKKNRPKEWELLVEKYDPSGEAQTNFASLAKTSA